MREGGGLSFPLRGLVGEGRGRYANLCKLAEGQPRES